MEFRTLGTLEVVADGRVVSPGARKLRTLLVILLLHANELVPADRLIDDLWSGRPPRSAHKVLQTYVSQLRRELGADRIVTCSPGYQLRADEDELDLLRFERLRRAGRYHEALALWRGEPLADFAYEPWAQGEIARLVEERLTTIEDRVDADLARGRHAHLAGELDTLVSRHPLRERLRGQWMLALYRCGRQAEALAAYRDGRTMMADELGLEPSADLQRLEGAILRQDPELDLRARQREIAADTSDASSFVGRVRERAELRALLGRGGLVTLLGPGGAGKTRLALELLGEEAALRRDGGVVVELASIRDAALVGRAVLRALGLPDPARRSVLETLAGYLADRELLLVLDNFEQIAAAAPLVAALLAGAPGLTILVTSRVALRLPGEVRYDVPPLGLPGSGEDVDALGGTDAVVLFVERAAARRSDFRLTVANAPVVGELCRRLDGLPLALELAAARVDALSPAAILARLGRRLDLLRATDPNVADRHSTLRAAIQWSHELLTNDQRSLFSALAVFAGGFTVDAAEAVTGDPDVVDRIPDLIDASLVRREHTVEDEPRFGMLETIGEYARERLAERSDAAELRDRHAAYFGAVAVEAESGLRGHLQASWLRRIDADRENLRVALARHEEAGQIEAGLRAAASLWRYQQFRGELADGRAQLERLLATDAPVSKRTRAEALAASGRLAMMHGEFEAARLRNGQALELFRELGDAGSCSLALTLLGIIAQGDGDPGQARAFVDEALALAREQGDWWTEVFALGCLGDVLYAAGDLEASRRTLEEARRLAREVGDLRNIARMEGTLASVLLEQGDHSRAADMLDDALALQRELGDRWGVARSLTGLGMAALAGGDADTARGHLEQALALQLRFDDRPGVAVSLECLGALAAADGDAERAASLYGAASVLREARIVSTLHVAFRDRDGAIASLATALGPHAFADAWSRGRSMTLAEVAAFAREPGMPTTKGISNAVHSTR